MKSRFIQCGNSFNVAFISDKQDKFEILLTFLKMCMLPIKYFSMILYKKKYNNYNHIQIVAINIRIYDKLSNHTAHIMPLCQLSKTVQDRHTTCVGQNDGDSTQTNGMFTSLWCKKNIEHCTTSL